MVPAHPSKHKIKRSQLVLLLAPTLGQEKSESLVVATGRTLGLHLGDELLLDQAVAILERLAEAEGIVGVVARFVQVRGELQALAPRSPVACPSIAAAGPLSAAATPGGGVAFAKQAPEPRIAVAEIVAFIAPALGNAAARDAVARYAAKVGAPGSDLTRAQAATLLESMSQAPGTLGVVASFAKARFILQHRG